MGAARDLAEGGVAHVVEAVHGVGARPVAQLVLGRVVHDAAQELARVVGDGGEEEQDADAEPPADPHRVGEAKQPDAHEAVGAVEDRLRQGGQVEVFLVECHERALGALGAMGVICARRLQWQQIMVVMDIGIEL